jgi:hypothetical protein
MKTSAALICAVALLALTGFLAKRKQQLTDPPRTFATPYRNVRPEVQYVGDEACSACHPRQSKTYRSHSMGRSLSPISTTVALERYDAAAHNPFDAAGFRYTIDRRGRSVFHKETAIGPCGGTPPAFMRSAPSG